MDLNAYVIYHAGCIDGFTAAWVCHTYFKETPTNIKYIPGVYQEKPKDKNGDEIIFKNSSIYLVDFSYKKDYLKELLDNNNKVTIIDHHKSAYNDLKDFDHLFLHKYFDLNHSGSMLCWKYFFGSKSEPPLALKNIEDRDLWKFQLPQTKEVVAALYSYEMTFEIWDELMQNHNIAKLYSEGLTLERKFNKDCKSLVEYMTRSVKFEGYTVPLINVPHMYSSEVGNILAKNNLFSISYYDTPEHRKFSLRSTDEGVDVSEIAIKYGGGGHRNAAGFKVDRNHELAKI